MTPIDIGSGMAVLADDKQTERLLEAYKEVCTSYHAIDDFRTKLLGILPVASIAGILVVGKDTPFAEGALQPLIGFASFGIWISFGLYHSEFVITLVETPLGLPPKKYSRGQSQKRKASPAA